MMKLLLAVIATCALVVSPTCIKIKHQLRSNAPTIDVVISNGNTQMTSQVSRNGSHRFITDNLSSMTLAPAGSQTIQLSYDQIFPLTDAAVCTEAHPLSAGGCADGVCCKISISMYTITDAIIMTARVNHRNADGNPQFWRCEQEIQVPGVTNTEPTGEEIAAEILHGEDPPAAGDIGGSCEEEEVECGNNAVCGEYNDGDKCKCKDGFGLTSGDATNCFVNVGGKCGEVNGETLTCGPVTSNVHCYSPSTSTQGTCTCFNGYKKDDNHAASCIDIDECHDNTHTHTCNLNLDIGATCVNLVPSFECICSSTTGWSLEDHKKRCIDINECTTNTTTLTCHQNAQCANTAGSYTCTCNPEYYGNGYITSEINTLNINPNSITGEAGTGCTACRTCETNQYCSACDPASATCTADYYADTTTCCKVCTECLTCGTGEYCEAYHDDEKTCCSVCAALGDVGHSCTEHQPCLNWLLCRNGFCVNMSG